MNRATKIAAVSIVVGVAVFALKYVAWLMTGSVALYSDALESIVNVAAAIGALAAIHYAAQPPDAEHPYGHHKAEYFSAAFEGAMIMLAAFFIFREAWPVLFAPRAIDWDDPGLLVNVAAGVINAAWGSWLIRSGRKLASPALEADGHHLWADVYTSIGVLGGVFLAAVTGFYLLDPLLAMAMAAHILFSGFKLVKASTDGLMDAAPDEETMKKLRNVIAAHAKGAIEMHDLKARRAGSALFVDFHLVVPADMTVNAAHAICDRIETGLEAAFDEDVHASIHVEPEHEREGRRNGAI
ncbi:MAG TPA: cation transporter, partial [Thermopetrobacter sp.]|nr:cation transporter [Thermopetrobacter sp.]